MNSPSFHIPSPSTLQMGIDIRPLHSLFSPKSTKVKILTAEKLHVFHLSSSLIGQFVNMLSEHSLCSLLSFSKNFCHKGMKEFYQCLKISTFFEMKTLLSELKTYNNFSIFPGFGSMIIGKFVLIQSIYHLSRL